MMNRSLWFEIPLDFSGFDLDSNLTWRRDLLPLSAQTWYRAVSWRRKEERREGGGLCLDTQLLCFFAAFFWLSLARSGRDFCVFSTVWSAAWERTYMVDLLLSAAMLA